jgi:hypothetical protein
MLSILLSHSVQLIVVMGQYLKVGPLAVNREKKMQRNNDTASGEEGEESAT